MSNDNLRVMRYALECPVESKVRFRQKVKVSWGQKTVYFERDDAGILTTIRIEGPVADDDRIVARIEETPSGITRFCETGGRRIYDELLADLQSLESIFPFYYNVTRIRWEAATCIVLPESPEEEAQIEFNHWKHTHEPPDPVTDIELDQFSTLVQLSLRCGPLASTLAFYREALCDMKMMRYITAYFSYYFVLEGLYGRGKTKNDAVEAQFKSSRPLGLAIQQCIDHGFPKAALGGIYTIQGLLLLLGHKVRGRFHR